MLSVMLRTLLILTLCVTSASCAAIQGIFKVGFWAGAGMVILALIVVLVIWTMLRGGGSAST